MLVVLTRIFVMTQYYFTNQGLAIILLLQTRGELFEGSRRDLPKYHSQHLTSW